MAKVIAIANQKGGVGKTTTCINLSAYAALMGKKVLTIDMDPQGNCSTGLGVDKTTLTASVYTALAGESEPSASIMRTRIENLHIMPSNIDLAGAEIELVSVEDRERALKKIISSLRANYDYIFIDCPPSLGLLTVNALTACDSVLIPIQGEFFALEGLSQLLNTLKLVTKILNPSLKIEGVILTMYDGRSRLVQSVAEDIQKYFGKSVYTTRIPRNVRLGEAPSYGLPIALYEPRSMGSIAYKALTEEFFIRNKVSYDKIGDIGALKVRVK